MHELLIAQTDRPQFLLGNEAIVRGALESGVSFVTAYPGTPSSEIIDRFSQLGEEAGVYVEYSVNEKVAMEVACRRGALRREEPLCDEACRAQRSRRRFHEPCVRGGESGHGDSSRR